ncbi:hypothetical protein [Oleiharenicola sp. Vm1]|uniref:hypothetical protein n=1 Tax=Oleiharenicola sp. Vm1 TaxID=3398393 RepID=UPI0039F62660
MRVEAVEAHVVDLARRDGADARGDLRQRPSNAPPWSTTGRPVSSVHRATATSSGALPLRHSCVAR